MRSLRRMAALTTATASAGFLLVAGAGVASAAPAAPKAPAASVHLTGGRTWVRTGPGIVTALLKNGIIPLAASPGTQRLTLRHGGAEHFAFPVTGGRVSLSPLGGKIRHHGGIVFLNAANGKQVEVSRFTINLAKSDLTGIVNRDPKVRVPIFWLNLKHAKLVAGKHYVLARNIGVRVTGTAARALDAALGTKLFTRGLKLGTAATLLRF